MEPQAIYEYETREIWCGNAEKKIYGVAYIPRRDTPAPLVIFAHELCHTYQSGTPYAKRLAARGLCVYTFDFRGGSPESRSGGRSTEMSVITEADDLKTVLDAAQNWTFADTKTILLLGASQGGAAAAVATLRDPKRVSGLMLLYPALHIPEAVRELFSSPEEVPEQYDLMGWLMVGRNYMTDVWNCDLYGKMKEYPNPVLLLHGGEDHVVAPFYSRRAAESFPDAEFHLIEGGRHGFSGACFEEAMTHILSYLRKIGVL